MGQINYRRRKTISLTILLIALFIVAFLLGGLIGYVHESHKVSKTSQVAVEQGRKQAATERAEAESELFQLKSQKTQAEEVVKSLSKQGDDLRAQIQQLQSEASSIKTNVDGKKQIEAEQAKKTENLKAVEQQIKDGEAKLQKLREDTAVAKLEANKKADTNQTQNSDAVKALENQIKARLAEIDKLNGELTSTKAELEKVKSRKDQPQTVDARVEDLQKIKDLQAKIQGLEKQVATVPTKSPNPDCNTAGAETGMVLFQTVNQLIKPSVDAINNDRTNPGYSLDNEHINYNRLVLQKSLKNYRAIIQNLINIEREKGPKFRAYVAQTSPRISETNDFDIQYAEDGKRHGNTIFNKDYLNRILDAANDEKTDMNKLNQVFEEGFWLFLQSHFLEFSKQADNWHIGETIVEANTRIYYTYHH